MDIAPRTISRIIKQELGLAAFKRQTEQRLSVALKVNRKQKTQDTSCRSTEKNVTKKSSLQMKAVYCGGNFQ